MHFKKFIVSTAERQGESFTRSLFMTSDEVWGDTDTGYINLKKDGDTAVLYTVACIISADKRTISFTVPKAETASFVGLHKIFVHLTKSDDATFDDIIAEYKITYSEES